MRERKSESKCSWTVSSELAAVGCVELFQDGCAAAWMGEIFSGSWEEANVGLGMWCK